MRQSTSTASRPGAGAGTWRLLPGQAVTLQPAAAGVLRVDSGALWATGDGPHAGPPDAIGDRLLGAGQALRLRAGERLVVEPVGRDAPARFDWQPA